MLALVLGIATVACVWLIGAFHFWRLQSASRAVTRVGLLDRAFALFWLPLGLCFVLLSLPSLVGMVMAARQRRHKLRGGGERANEAARCGAPPHVVRLPIMDKAECPPSCSGSHEVSRTDKVSRG